MKDGPTGTPRALQYHCVALTPKNSSVSPVLASEFIVTTVAAEIAPLVLFIVDFPEIDTGATTVNVTVAFGVPDTTNLYRSPSSGVGNVTAKVTPVKLLTIVKMPPESDRVIVVAAVIAFDDRAGTTLSPPVTDVR